MINHIKLFRNMRKLVSFIVIGMVFVFAGCKAETNTEKLQAGIATKKSKIEMEHLTKETFLEKVFNYEENKDWKYEGDLPCIIDFYADWCGPCKMVAPILEELSKEYEGKIHIYKVDTEDQQELAAAFGIRSIPSILFVPMDEQPQMAQGALPKATFKKAIEEVLLKVEAAEETK